MTSVGVNLLWCIPGAVGGSEEYLARQLAGLGPCPDGLDVTVFALRGYAAAHRDVAQRFPLVTAPIDGRRRGVRVAFEHTWLPARARERRVELLHHAGGTLPRAQPAPGVLTIHDLQYLQYPDFFSRTKLWWLATAVPASVARAAIVTVPSNFVKGTVVEAFGYPADRVVVVPHGLVADGLVAHGLGAGDGGPPVDEPTLRRRYALPGRIVLYPAITHPHKNHVTLLRAVAALGPGHDDVRLVLLGGAGLADGDVAAEIGRLGLGDRVVRPGRVSDADRDGLYRIATVTAFPSRYEGFGAPVLEAMALGCPVVAAGAAALPEVTGGAALLADPDDPEAWRAGLTALLDDDAERARLVAAGRRRAAAFTAEASAAALLTAYRLALGHS